MADNYLLFSAHIRSAYPTMTRKERQIADYMLANTDSLFEATAESIGAATGTSGATVIRFCRTCGFNGLTELKLSLKKENKIVDPNPVNEHNDDGAGYTAAIIKQRVLGYHNLVINAMLDDWNIEAYDMAVDEILRARRVVLIGEGGSRSSCMFLYYQLLSAGIRCEICTDSVFEIMIVDSLTEEDLVIGISYTGRIKTTLESMKLARSKGICTIGLIGRLDSPITEYTSIVLNTASIYKDFYDSEMSVRISENIVIEILITILSLKQRAAGGKHSMENPIINLRRMT